MIKINDAKSALEQVKLRAMVVGPPGSGKTHFCSTAPRSYLLHFNHGEADTYLTRPSLTKNIIGIDYFVPNGDAGLKEIFGDLDKGVGNGTLHKAIQEAKELHAKGEIDTLVIDPITHLVDYLWQYINRFCAKLTHSGDVDTRGMYGDLNTKLMRLVGIEIGSFPGNLLVTAHEMLESDEAMEKKPDKTSPVVANILGGFRNKIEGMFSLVMYLTKLDKGKGVYEYWARCNKGSQRNAKSRLPIPNTIKDISYNKIMEEIKKTVTGGE